MELQLAESGLDYSPYIYVPNKQTGGGVYIREDKFDTMSEDDYDEFMDEIEPYEFEQEGISEGEFLSKRADRKARRTERRKLKSEKKTAKTDIKKARAEKKRASGGGKGMDIFNKATETVGKVFGGDKSADAGSGGDAEPKKDNTIYWIVGGAATLFLIGGVYIASKPKKVG